MASNKLIYEKDEGLGVIIVNGAKNVNALGGKLVAELAELFKES